MDSLISAALNRMEIGLDAPQTHDPGKRWDAYAKAIRSRAYDFETVKEVIAFAQSQAAGIETRFTNPDAMSDEAEAELADLFPHFAKHLTGFADSPLAENVAIHNGRLVSYPTFYKATRFLLSCLSHTKPKTICEIGGGYGLPAKLWLENPIHQPDRYIIVDFPEVLFLADVYLSAHFPEAIESGRVVLCPIGQIGTLAGTHLDLVINTLSMGEMSDAYVDFYMDWLDRQSCRYFYSWNFAATPIDTVKAETGSAFVPRLSKRWRTIVANHPGQLCGELLAERTDPEPQAEFRKWWPPSPLNQDRYFKALQAVRFNPEAARVLTETAPKELGYTPRELTALTERSYSAA